MKIAQVAPLYESVPPKLYGGTERVVSYLTEELVRQKHEVTLYASGDSVTRARLVSPCVQSLRLDEHCVDSLARHILLLERVFQEANDYDVIHFHVDYLHFPFSRRLHHPHVTTLHGRLDIPELPDLYREFKEIPVISISNAQREPLPWANWQGTVYHGLPADLLSFHAEAGQYLAFLGRISREKRVDRAIEIASRAGMKLKIAAKIDKADTDYFKEHVEPLMHHPLVEYVGEVSDQDKEEFLGQAAALLFPIDWPEPFGLVMIEALACGTPVIAWPCGSVPEVIEDGTTGFIVTNVAEAARAVSRISSLSRRRCRQVFEERFSALRMAHDYLAIYRHLQEQRGKTRQQAPAYEPALPVQPRSSAGGEPQQANSRRAQ